MKTIAFLDYSFVFPLDSMGGYEFERDLVDFFNQKGLDAQVIETKGGTGRRLFYITRREVTPMPIPTTIVKTPKQALREFKQNLPQSAK